MTSLTNDNVVYAPRTAEIGAVAHGRGHYFGTVALRISVLVVAPALFWGGVLSIIF